MSKFLPSLFFFFLGIYCLQAQNTIGAAAVGEGFTNVTRVDAFSALNNPATLGDLKGFNAAAFFENRFNVGNLSNGAFALSKEVTNGTIALGFNNFGFGSLINQQFTGAYGRTFADKVSFGMAFHYRHLRYETFYKRALTLSVGGLVKLNKDLNIAFSFYNPINTKFNDLTAERLPLIGTLGLQKKLSKKVTLRAEVDKDLEWKPDFKFGIAYQPDEKIFLRAGISTQQFLYTFGIGYKQKGFIVDFASSFHPQLGMSSHVNLGYQFIK